MSLTEIIEQWEALTEEEQRLAVLSLSGWKQVPSDDYPKWSAEWVSADGTRRYHVGEPNPLVNWTEVGPLLEEFAQKYGLTPFIDKVTGKPFCSFDYSENGFCDITETTLLRAICKAFYCAVRAELVGKSEGGSG